MKAPFWILLLLLQTAGLGAERVHAYDWYRTTSGEPLRWWQKHLTWHLGATNPQEFPAADLRSLLEQSLQTWLGPACNVPTSAFGGVTTDTEGTAPTTLTETGDNLIVMIDSRSEWDRLGNSPTWISIAKIAHDPDTGRIIDADIEINDGVYTFSTDGSPGSNEVDFQSALTHEFGHFLGMADSPVLGATMYSAPNQDAEGRSLESDDVTGLCALYANVPTCDCEGSNCGANNCGESCGDCGTNGTCEDGHCSSPECPATCAGESCSAQACNACQCRGGAVCFGAACNGPSIPDGGDGPDAGEGSSTRPGCEGGHSFYVATSALALIYLVVQQTRRVRRRHRLLRESGDL